MTCACGHTAHWHSHEGAGLCEHDGECCCGRFRPLPIRSEIPNPMDVAVVDLDHAGNYQWRIVSDCGVVKVYSSRDGCMMALNSYGARKLAEELSLALNVAADTTDVRSYGYIVDREGRRVS